jgi:voltage-gated potassium channel
MIKPQVSAFLNDLTRAGVGDYSLEEIEVGATCGAVGLTIGELDIAKQTGANILAIRKSDGGLETRPSKESRLENGDVIVGVGSSDEIRKLEKMFEPREALA